MSSKKSVRLRGSAERRIEEYPLGEVPDRVVQSIGEQLVHLIAIGRKDISGDDFGEIFAQAIGGAHRGKPLGVADVTKEKCAWSTKTVKAGEPFKTKTVRLISGRNDVAYSLGIENSKADIQNTGDAVLRIWNARVNEALKAFEDLRILVFVRNMQTRKFLIYEEEAHRFNVQHYEWRLNKRNNLEGYERSTGKHRFTWQTGGRQFTIKDYIPFHVKKFTLPKDIPSVSKKSVLKDIEFASDWITIL